jgi:5-methyltetrahydrofolate--homocysteine methyltransferase
MMNELMDPARARLAISRTFSGAEAPVVAAPVGSGARRAGRISAVQRCAPTFRFPPRLIWTARCATCRTCRVWSYINPFMLYGRHLGFKGNFEKLLAERDPKGAGTVSAGGSAEGSAKFHEVRAVWQFFEAERDGNSIHLFRAGARDTAPHVSFGRQPKSDGLCLSDYILPPKKAAAITWPCSW